MQGSALWNLQLQSESNYVDIGNVEQALACSDSISLHAKTLIQLRKTMPVIVLRSLHACMWISWAVLPNGCVNTKTIEFWW